MDGETGSDQPVSGVASAIPATLVLAPDRAGERSTPVYDWLVVGRECAGVDERHRLLIDDPAVSRTHLELRLDLELDQAWLTDHSTNGTRLNGQRIERSVRGRTAAAGPGPGSPRTDALARAPTYGGTRSAAPGTETATPARSPAARRGVVIAAVVVAVSRLTGTSSALLRIRTSHRAFPIQ